MVIEEKNRDNMEKVESNSPVTVDIVHLHRGYVSDCTRMFSAGKLNEKWMERLDDMVEIRNKVVSSLGSGDNCSKTWEIGSQLAKEMGYENNLMGMLPDKSYFLGHSVGLELDETPVIAKGFDRPLNVGGTMAIEPKVIYENGCIGTEDTFVRTRDGMEYLTMGDKFLSLQIGIKDKQHTNSYASCAIMCLSPPARLKEDWLRF